MDKQERKPWDISLTRPILAYEILVIISSGILFCLILLTTDLDLLEKLLSYALCGGIGSALRAIYELGRKVQRNPQSSTMRLLTLFPDQPADISTWYWLTPIDGVLSGSVAFFLSFLLVSKDYQTICTGITYLIALGIGFLGNLSILVLDLLETFSGEKQPRKSDPIAHKPQKLDPKSILWIWGILVYDLGWLSFLLWSMIHGWILPIFRHDIIWWQAITGGSLGTVLLSLVSLFKHAGMEKDFDQSYVLSYIVQPLFGAFWGIIVATALTFIRTGDLIFLFSCVAGFYQWTILRMMSWVINRLFSKEQGTAP